MAAIAKVLCAEHFILMTNIAGLLERNKQIVHHVTTADNLQRLLSGEVIAATITG